MDFNSFYSFKLKLHSFIKMRSRYIKCLFLEKIFSIKVIFSLILFLSVYAKAESSIQCRNLFINTTGGAAIELEMPLILKILTTVDGTVGGLYNSTKMQLPDFFISWARSNYPLIEPGLIPWERLDNEPLLQLDLLKYQSHNKTSSNFYLDRQIPNIKVRPILNLHFEKETEFLGKTYQPGDHKIKLESNLGKVEFGGPNAVNDFSEVELHLLSSSISAGKLFLSSWRFQEAIGDKKRPLHGHLLAPVPRKAIQTNALEMGLVIAELYRQFELLSEFITIGMHEGIYFNKSVENKIKLKGIFNLSIEKKVHDNFGPMPASNLISILRYFATGANFELGTTAKSGWVGFRSHGFYKSKDHYGFEWRSPTGLENEMLIEKIANNVHKALMSEQYGISDREMKEWALGHSLDLYNFKALNKLAEKWWYIHPYNVIEKNIPQYIKGIFGNSIMSYIRMTYLKENAMDNEGVKMLLYDWTQDPIFSFSGVETKQKLIMAQQKALTDFFYKGIHIKVALKDFVWTSGLLERVSKTFKLDSRDFDDLYHK